MIEMTHIQRKRLEWFAQNGARGHLEESMLIMDSGAKTPWRGVLTIVHLVARGAIAGDQGYLCLTDYGRRLLEGADTGELPL